MVQATVALRVDVDTHRGLQEGVPRLLELFRRQGVRASFFVTMGPDRSGAAIRRAWRPSFLRKMWRTNAPRLYGLRTILSGTLLKSRPVGSGSPGLLRQIAAEGHELGPHGFDHVGWQDGVARWRRERIRADLAAAARAFEAALGVRPQSSAAPGWRTTMGALRIQDELGYVYATDVRGPVPFRPWGNGGALKTLQIPTTLPTMDELLGAVRDIPGALHDALPPGLSVFTLHAEVEGGPLLAVLADFLERVRQGGALVGPLREAVDIVRHTDVAVLPVVRGAVRGRSGWVATPGAPVSASPTWRRALAVLLLGIGVVMSASGCATLERRPAEMPLPPTPAVPDEMAKPSGGAEQARLTEQVTRIAAELAELQNALVRLIAASRDHEAQLQSLQRRLTELATQQRDGVGGVPRGFAPSPGNAPSPPAGASPASTPARELYQTGLAKFRAGERDAAILILYDLIANYPEDRWRESAQFLVGDILYEQKDLRGALAEFEGLLSAVPSASRAPDALLKIGLCQRGLGDEARARRAWERLVKEYPNSLSAGQARVLLRAPRQG